MIPAKALQRLTTSSDHDYTIFRKDLWPEEKRNGKLSMYSDKHPYFRMGQRSLYHNNSTNVAKLIHAGATDNFPEPDTKLEQYPGFPFGNKPDAREQDLRRKIVGESTFALWDKPLISKGTNAK